MYEEIELKPFLRILNKYDIEYYISNEDHYVDPTLCLYVRNKKLLSNDINTQIRNYITKTMDRYWINTTQCYIEVRFNIEMDNFTKMKIHGRIYKDPVSFKRKLTSLQKVNQMTHYKCI